MKKVYILLTLVFTINASQVAAQNRFVAKSAKISQSERLEIQKSLKSLKEYRKYCTSG